MKMKNTISNQMTIKDLSMSSQNFLQVRNISVKRTSGVRTLYRKIQKELGELKQEDPPTGETIMDLVNNLPISSSSLDPITTNEKYSDYATPKEKCPTTRQSFSSIMTSS